MPALIKLNASMDHYMDELFNKGYLDIDSLDQASDLALTEHLITMAFSFTLFMTLFAIIYISLYYVIKPKFAETQLTVKERADMVLTINMQVNHLFVFSCACYSVLFMCKKPFDVFYLEETCIRTYRPWYSQLIAFNFAYYIYDVLIAIVLLRDFST